MDSDVNHDGARTEASRKVTAVPGKEKVRALHELFVLIDVA